MLFTVKDIIENVKFKGPFIIKEEYGNSVKTIYMTYDYNDNFINEKYDWMTREIKCIHPITTMLNDSNRKLHQTAAIVIEI